MFNIVCVTHSKLCDNFLERVGELYENNVPVILREKDLSESEYEELAKKAVSAMRNVDGTTGEHWSMEKTNPLAEQNGIKEKADFYYTMNMLYSDFSDVLGSEASTYVKMAKAYMHDPDAPEGKVFDIWLAQMKREDK